MKIGTAAQLKLNVGDVVDTIDWLGDSFTRYQTVLESNIIDSGQFYGQYEIRLSDYGKGIFDDEKFRILTRATPQPKLWRDMTAEEKGALLLAAHEGKVIEWSYGLPWVTAYSTDTGHYPAWSDTCAYRVRIKPEPKVETVRQHWKTNKKGEFVPMNQYDVPHDPTHRITFATVDGKPDCASVKMEHIE